MNVFKADTDYFFMTEDYERDSYYCYHSRKNIGIVKMRFVMRSLLEQEAWYVARDLKNVELALGKPFPEKYTGILYSDCKDNTGFAYLVEGFVNPNLDDLNVHLDKFEDINDSLIYPRGFLFT